MFRYIIPSRILFLKQTISHKSGGWTMLNSHVFLPWQSSCFLQTIKITGVDTMPCFKCCLFEQKTMWHHELYYRITRIYTTKLKLQVSNPQSGFYITEHTDLFPLSPKTGFSSGSKANWRPAEVRKGSVAMVRCQEFQAVCLVAKIAIYNFIIFIDRNGSPFKVLDIRMAGWMPLCQSFPFIFFISEYYCRGTW